MNEGFCRGTSLTLLLKTQIQSYFVDLSKFLDIYKNANVPQEVYKIYKRSIRQKCAGKAENAMFIFQLSAKAFNSACEEFLQIKKPFQTYSNTKSSTRCFCRGTFRYLDVNFCFELCRKSFIIHFHLYPIKEIITLQNEFMYESYYIYFRFKKDLKRFKNISQLFIPIA